MSKSRKKFPVVKIRGWLKDVYWGIVRSRQKHEILAGKDVSNPKTIIGDWDYIDYISKCMNDDNCRCVELFGWKRCLNK